MLMMGSEERELILARLFRKGKGKRKRELLPPKIHDALRLHLASLCKEDDA
jgi:hypothetical protein